MKTENHIPPAERTAVGYTWNEYQIPEALAEGLDAYIRNGRQVGHFLTAVICNNLHDACSRADHESWENIHAILGYLYNEAPAPCWGSKEKMHAWMERFSQPAEVAA